jgi:branched-chain amino acid transport system permease protein
MNVNAYLIIQGLVVGSIYGLIALGVVLIYKTSEVLNFAHGNMGMIASFFSYTLMEKYMPKIMEGLTGSLSGIGFMPGEEWGGYLAISFTIVLVIVFAMAFLLGMAIEFFTLRPITKWKVLFFVVITGLGCGLSLMASHMVPFYIFLFFFLFFFVEFLTMGPAKEPTQLGLIVVTIGIWLILDGVASSVFGTQDHALPHPLGPESFEIVTLWGIPVSQLELIIMAITLILIVFLFFFFRYSKAGTAMRATSQVETAARLMGIKTKRVFALTWGISSVLGAIAGILAASKFFINTNTMLFPFLKAFAAATMGGLTSLPGAIIGGWILGITENLFGYYISMDLKTPFAFLVIIVVLSIRPSGLLSKHYVKKV